MAGHDTTTFGTLLRRYRLAAALTQMELAERAGLSRDAINLLERGRRSTPRLETVTRLATALELDPVERRALLGTITERPASPTAALTDPPSSLPAAGPPSSLSRIRLLPTPLTTILGREHEVVMALHLLHSASDGTGTRLLSLIGPGGVGKTRLAVAIADAVQDAYAAGVAFIDLSALSDSTLVLPVIAQVLGVRESGVQSAHELLVAHLQDRRLLLILDNFEQVVDAASSVAELLEACPRLVVLVTSRAALRVRGEQLLPVPPLAVPPAERPTALHDVAGYTAVQLFVARAQAIQPTFQLDAANAGAVAAICARLDGLPLAIELAAAWVAALSPQALLERLQHAAPSAVLTRGVRDLPERQQTLSATIDWSYELLPPDEQTLLRRLAVFVSGCTLDAAETICQDDDPPDGPVDRRGDVLEGMTALLDKSLVQRDRTATAEPRYGMLEMIRAYALERLGVSGDAERLRQRHAAYYLALAEQADGEPSQGEQAAWLERLEHEHDNLRAALTWAQHSGDVGFGVRLAGVLWRFWYIHGYLSEGRRWLDGVLAQAAGCDPTVAVPDQARALFGASVLANTQGDHERAALLCEESLVLYQALGDRAGIAAALSVLGNVAINRGDYGRAVALSEESLAVQHELGSRRGLALALNNLGGVVLLQGDYERATALCEQSLALARELGDQRGSGAALTNLADAARARGAPDRALALYRQAVPLYQAMGDTEGLAICLEGIATARAHGHAARAARLFGAAAALRRTIGAPVSPVARPSYECATAAVRAALGDRPFTAAWTVGQNLSLEQALADAQAEE